MDYPYSYGNYKYGGDTYGLSSVAGPYDWAGGGFSTTPFSVQPEKPKFDLTGTLYGAGALAEGIGNLIRGIRGDDVPPSRMAGQALDRYLQKDQPDTLTALLSKIIQERQGQKSPLLKGGSDIFNNIFG